LKTGGGGWDCSKRKKKDHSKTSGRKSGSGFLPEKREALHCSSTEKEKRLSGAEVVGGGRSGPHKKKNGSPGTPRKEGGRDGFAYRGRGLLRMSQKEGRKKEKITTTANERIKGKKGNLDRE